MLALGSRWWCWQEEAIAVAVSASLEAQSRLEEEVEARKARNRLTKKRGGKQQKVHLKAGGNAAGLVPFQCKGFSREQRGW